MIYRRLFLTSLVGGLAATAAVRTFPFRVYSFPSEIKNSKPSLFDPNNPSIIREFVGTEHLWRPVTLQDFLAIPGVISTREDFTKHVLQVGLAKDLSKEYTVFIKEKVESLRPIGVLAEYEISE